MVCTRRARIDSSRSLVDDRVRDGGFVDLVVGGDVGEALAGIDAGDDGGGRDAKVAQHGASERDRRVDGDGPAVGVGEGGHERVQAGRHFFDDATIVVRRKSAEKIVPSAGLPQCQVGACALLDAEMARKAANVTGLDLRVHTPAVWSKRKGVDRAGEPPAHSGGEEGFRLADVVRHVGSLADHHLHLEG